MSFQNFKFSFQIFENEFHSWAICAIRSFRANPYRRVYFSWQFETDQINIQIEIRYGQSMAIQILNHEQISSPVLISEKDNFLEKTFAFLEETRMHNLYYICQLHIRNMKYNWAFQFQISGPYLILNPLFWIKRKNLNKTQWQ